MTPLDFHIMTRIPFVGEPIYIDWRRVVTEDGMFHALGHVFPIIGRNAVIIENLRRHLSGWAQDDIFTPVQIRQ